MRVQTFDVQHGGRPVVVGLARVRSVVFHADTMDRQLDDALVIRERVLLAGEYLNLVLVPAYDGVGLAELAVHLHDHLLLLALAVRQLLDPVVLRLRGRDIERMVIALAKWVGRRKQCQKDSNSLAAEDTEHVDN